MSQVMLSTKLYQKTFAEQELFKAELMLLSPIEVLDQSYVYVCREDILMALQYNAISSRQALALLKPSTPLAYVFKKWEGREESHHMENIWNAVEARANEVVWANFIDAKRDAR